MSTPELLEPADSHEAEMAKLAYQCLMAALDHSHADHFDVILDSPGVERHSAPVLKLPPKALHFFAEVLRTMAKRQPMLLMPQKHELTTQEAAAFLNVSRPFLIKELEAGHLPFRKVNKHRRIEFEALRQYQQAQQNRSESALDELSRLSQAAGLDF